MEAYAVYILKINILAAACILMVLLITRFVKKRYSSHWKYMIWLFVALFLLFPIDIFAGTAIIKFEIPQKINLPNVAASDKNHIDKAENDASISDTTGKSMNAQNAVKRTVVTGSILDTSEGVLKGFLYIWLIGIACFSLCRILSYRFSMTKLFRWGVPVLDKEILLLYQSVCQKGNMKKPPKLMVSSKINGPLLVGLKTACLYLPDCIYTEAELKLIFAHELNHYRHKDLWYKMLLLIVKTIYWFNPIITIMVKEAEKDIEYICDSRVIEHCSAGESTLYNRLLLKTAAAQSHIHYVSASLNDSATSFKERITYMRKAKYLKRGVIPAMLLSTVLLVSNMLVGCTGNTENTTPGSSDNTEALAPLKTDKGTSAAITETDQTEKRTGEFTEKVEQTEKQTEAATDEVNPAVEQTESEPATEKSSSIPAAVSAKLQVYEGSYLDTRNYGDNDRPDYSPITCEIVISNVTDSSFDFTVHEVNSQTGEDNVIFQTHTAIFIGDGTEAAFYGNEYTLNFTFPDDHISHPAVTDMQVSGFSPLEGFTYANGAIPGHGFG